MPPIKCSYFMCNNTSKDFSLFRFPTGHASRLAVWLRNCGNMTITHLGNQELRNRYLCIRHFDDRFIKKKTGKRKTLSKIAVPQHHKDEQISVMTPLSPCESVSTSQARATSPVLKVLKPTKVYKSQLICNIENDNEFTDFDASLCFDTPEKRKSTDTPKYTSEFPEPVASAVEVQTQQVPEPHQTRLENPVSQPRPARSRRRLRHYRPSLNSNTTSILLTRSDREWVKELERNRVRAENKMADATLMIAEAAKKIAKASQIIAESNRMNAETNRKQLEVMKAIMDIVRQRAALATGVSDTAVHQKEKEGRNADKQQEPPEKRYRARKRSRQTHSSSEADSSDDNDGDNELSSNYQDEEPEIEVGPGSVKIEPNDIEVNKEQAQTDPISLDVKPEPRDDEVDITNETLALNEPARTKRYGRKIPRIDVTSTRSGLFGETEMKTEEIEINEEGFS